MAGPKRLPGWKPPDRTDRHDALETLSDSVRRLIEATVTTGHEPVDLRALAAEVDAVAARLEERLDEDPWQARTSGPGVDDARSMFGINPAIGAYNPIAPVVEVEVGPDRVVRGTVTFSLAHVGPPDRAHGGVLASVMDQILGLAATAAGAPGFTGTMTVRYRHATPLHVPIRLEASCTPTGERTSTAQGALFDPQGRLTVEAEAVFVRGRET